MKILELKYTTSKIKTCWMNLENDTDEGKTQ